MDQALTEQDKDEKEKEEHEKEDDEDEQEVENRLKKLERVKKEKSRTSFFSTFSSDPKILSFAHNFCKELEEASRFGLDAREKASGALAFVIVTPFRPLMFHSVDPCYTTV